METKTLYLLDILKNTQALYSPEFVGDYEPPADLLELLTENEGTSDDFFYGVMFFQKFTPKTMIVVDGMNRIISFSLLLHALCECYKLTNEKNIKAISNIKNRYLFGKFGMKVQLSGYEKNIYEKLVGYKKMTDEEKCHPMFVVLHEFWAKIKMNNISASSLFEEIKKVKVIVVVADEFEVENRDLYQSLNCQNSNLDTIKMITDFVNETCGKKAELWHEILNLFKDNGLAEQTISFLKNFLTIQKNGIIPKDNEIYTAYKCYMQKTRVYQNLNEIFKNQKRFVKYYLKLIHADFPDYEIQKQMVIINENCRHETYPYLLEVMEDLDNERIDNTMFLEILNAINLFVKNKNENNLSSCFDFANLSRELNERLGD